MEKYKDLTILIAEDDDGHADLIMTGLKESGICNHMIRFIDGKQAWDFISGEGKDMVLTKKNHTCYCSILKCLKWMALRC